MPTEPFVELAPEDLAEVDGGLGLRNAAYAAFVAGSFWAGQPAGPLLDIKPPMAPMSQTVGAR